MQSIFLFRSVHISALGEHRSSNLWFGRLCFPPSVVRTSVVAVIARRLLSIRPLGIFAQYRVRHVILEVATHFFVSSFPWVFRLIQLVQATDQLAHDFS